MVQRISAFISCVLLFFTSYSQQGIGNFRSVHTTGNIFSFNNTAGDVRLELCTDGMCRIRTSWSHYADLLSIIIQKPKGRFNPLNHTFTGKIHAENSPVSVMENDIALQKGIPGTKDSEHGWIFDSINKILWIKSDLAISSDKQWKVYFK